MAARRRGSDPWVANSRSRGAAIGSRRQPSTSTIVASRVGSVPPSKARTSASTSVMLGERESAPTSARSATGWRRSSARMPSITCAAAHEG